MASEEWRVILDFPAYEVSNWGKIRRRLAAFSGRQLTKLQSPVGKILKPAVVKGYFQVSLSGSSGRKNAKVHRLVCEAFHGKALGKQRDVIHIDGNPFNNAAVNLRWATSQENNLDRRRHGTMPRGASHPRTKLTAQQIHEIRMLCDTGIPRRTIAQRFATTYQNIRAIEQRKTWAWLA
jgi:hypothetical protein